MNKWLEKYQEGGQEGMMKGKMAIADAMGNTAAHRMIQNYPPTYKFTGKEQKPKWSDEEMPEEGSNGTHFMASMGRYAVPLIQQDSTGKLQYNIKASPRDKESIRFNNEDDAEYFANHYKEVAPMMRNSNQYQEGGKISKTGYKQNSKDRFEPSLIIPSNNITMDSVQFPIMAYPNNDQPVLMQPDQNYNFPNSTHVKEVPLRAVNARGYGHMQMGGQQPTQQDSLNLYNNTNEVNKYLNENYKLKQSIPYNPNTDNFNRTNDSVVNYINTTGPKVFMNNPYYGKSELYNNPSQYSGLPMKQYRNNIDDNHYTQRDLNINEFGAEDHPKAFGTWRNKGHETRIVNTEMPAPLFDKRIEPQQYNEYRERGTAFSAKEQDEQMMIDMGLGHLSGINRRLAHPIGYAKRDDVAMYQYDPLAVKPWNMQTPDEQQQRVQKYGYPKQPVQQAPVQTKPEPQWHLFGDNVTPEQEKIGYTQEEADKKVNTTSKKYGGKVKTGWLNNY